MVAANGVGKRLVKPEAIDIEDLSGEDIYVTQRGFKLKIIPVPIDVIVEARSRVKVPQAPVNPARDGDGKVIRDVFDQNYADPKYIREMDEYNSVIKRLTFQVMAAYGVLAYAVPPGEFGPDDEGWIKLLEEDDIFDVGEESFRPTVPGPDRPRARFAEWLRLHVLTQQDGEVLNDAFLHGMGKVLEQDVEEAVESFPGGQG